VISATTGLVHNVKYILKIKFNICFRSSKRAVKPQNHKGDEIAKTFCSKAFILQPRMGEIAEVEELGDVWFQQDGAAAHTTPNWGTCGSNSSYSSKLGDV
jgi:hypothetical protein